MRKDLKDHKSLKDVSINEDLTKATSELTYKARQLKRASQIAGTFTSGRKVVSKKYQSSSFTLIKNERNLRDLGSLQNYNQVLNRQGGAAACPRDYGIGSRATAEHADSAWQSAVSTPSSATLGSSQAEEVPGGSAVAMDVTISGPDTTILTMNPNSDTNQNIATMSTPSRTSRPGNGDNSEFHGADDHDISGSTDD